MARISPRFVVLLPIFLIVVAAHPRVQSEPVVISDDPSCSDCLIRIDLETSLEPNPDDGFFCSEMAIVAGLYDRLFVIDPLCPEPKALGFDFSGQRTVTVGGQGQGPGEMTRPRAIWGHDNGLVYVFEPDRLHVFTSDGEFRYSVAFPKVPTGFASLPDGRSVVAAWINSRELVGVPLHILDENGRIVDSFGEVAAVHSAEGEMDLNRIAAPSRRSGRVWTAGIYSYEIDEWELDAGTKVRSFLRRAEWFDTDVGSGTVGWSRIRALREDDDGFLWTISNVLVSESTLGNRPSLSESFDTVIEVIDPETGVVVASQREDKFFFGWAGDLAFSFREGSELNIIVDAWRISLVGRRQN